MEFGSLFTSQSNPVRGALYSATARRHLDRQQHRHGCQRHDRSHRRELSKIAGTTPEPLPVYPQKRTRIAGLAATQTKCQDVWPAVRRKAES
jgi:hypothetical protein